MPKYEKFTSEPTLLRAPSCKTCRHRVPDSFRFCTAFPKGIPVEIQLGEIDHKSPHEGDHGIRYEPLG